MLKKQTPKRFEIFFTIVDITETLSQLAFNCSKLTIETLKKDVKYVQS